LTAINKEVAQYKHVELKPVNPGEEKTILEEDGKGVIKWISLRAIGTTYEGGCKSEIRIYVDGEVEPTFRIHPEIVAFDANTENAEKVGITIWDPVNYESLIWCRPEVDFSSHIKISFKNADLNYPTKLGGGILLKLRR
jgi:hypothetical protein